MQIIPSGARFLPPGPAAEKLGRKKSWLYDKLKTDPTFPRPVTLGDKSGPVFLEHELEAWMAGRVDASRTKGDGPVGHAAD